MAEKFMYVCFGMLALMMAFHLGARYGYANYVDHSMAGVVAAEIHGSGDGFLLFDNGEVWEWEEYTSQQWSQWPSPPVPVSDIKFWHHRTLVDTDNQLWHEEGGEWFNRGGPPGGVGTEPSTWGSIKARWREEE
jgi:hypothetical protein